VRVENFSRRRLKWILAIGGVSLAFGILLGIFQGDLMEFRSWSTDSFSKSAIGHKGFAELLRGLDIPLIVSTHASGSKAGTSGLLIIAEPTLTDTASLYTGLFDRMLRQSHTRIIVLPKWRGIPLVGSSMWVEAMVLMNKEAASSVLEALGIEARVVRITDSTVTLNWDRNSYGVAPQLLAPQLMAGDQVEPLIACDEGTLLGAVKSGHTNYAGVTVILSDPDLIANHGLARGDNALLAVRIVDHLRNDGGVVLDETIHGFSLRRSIWRSFFEYPLILVLLQVFLLAGVILWTASIRFGSPIRYDRRIASGKGYLIQNTASLLRHGAHHRYLIGRYFNSSIRHVAQNLHLSGWATTGDTIARLDAIGKRRGVGVDLGGLTASVRELEAKQDVTASEAVSAAWRIHKWRKGMTDGT